MSDLPHNVHYQPPAPNNLQSSQDRFCNRNHEIRNFANSCNETFKRPYSSTDAPVVGSVSNRFPAPMCSERRTSVSSGFITNQQFPRPEGPLNGPPPPFRPPLEMPCSSPASSYSQSVPQQPPISTNSFQLQPPPQAVHNSNIPLPFPQQQNVSFPLIPPVNNQPYMCSRASQIFQPNAPQQIPFQRFSMPPPPITHSSVQSYGATSNGTVPQHTIESQKYTSQVNSSFIPQGSVDYRSPPFAVTSAQGVHSMPAPPRLASASDFSQFPPSALCTVPVPVTSVMVRPNNDSILISNCNSTSVNSINSLQSGQNVYQPSSSVTPSSGSSLRMHQEVLKPPPPLQNHLLPFVGNLASEAVACNVTPPENSEKALKNLLDKFKQKVSVTAVKKEDCMSVAEYVSLVKSAWCHLQELSNRKTELKSLIHCDTRTWDHKVKSIVKQQNVLCDILNKITDSRQMGPVLSKLQKIRKKRSRMKRLKEQCALMKNAKTQQRENLHRELDRWHEVSRERDEQQKRDAEMKKEADYILSEVHKKIQEARRAIEKLKMLEKLRHVRKENALKKGMLFLPSQDRSFEAKLSEMKEVMQKQLSDYEAEERALKVMLETEQEGQREMEAEWRLKKLKELQEKKHSEIISSLFGKSEPPNPEDPMFLFHQYYDSGSKSIDSLIQIRHTWDIYLVSPDSMEGSSIPERWVVPNPPSDEIWHTALATSAK